MLMSYFIKQRIFNVFGNSTVCGLKTPPLSTGVY